LRGREALGDALGAAESLNNIGFSHYQLGDYDSAQVFWRQAEEAFTRLDDQNGIVRTQQNLGLLETARGNWKRARQLLQRSLATAQRQQLAEEEAVSRRNLAELDLLQGHYSDALAHLARAEALFTERDDHRGRIDAMLLRARLQLDVGDAGAAREALAAAGEALAQASSEQRVIAALLQAELAQRAQDRTAVQAALRQADALLATGATRLLRLQYELLHQPDDAQLPAALDALGHRPLWLRHQQLALERALAAGDSADAARRYRALLPELETLGDYAHAWRLHRLGVRALQDDSSAAAAQAAADRALAALRAAAPEALRASIDREANPS
jgi:eukaryotic-like serine/threonine-protein kinase